MALIRVVRCSALLACLVLAQSLLAQSKQSEASTRFALSGLVNSEQIGDLFLVDESSRPAVKPVGVIKINPEATGVSVAAFRMVNGNWELITARELTPLVFVIETPGNWMVAIRGVGVTGPPFFNLVIGPSLPQPPPQPPPIGDFSELAAKSKQLVAQVNDQPTAAALAVVLERASQQTALDMLGVKAYVSPAISATLLARTGASRDKNWQGIWRKPIDDEIIKLSAAGKIPDANAYRAVLRALSESMR